MSSTESVNEFHFCKEHLQILANRLWIKMQPHLDGDYDCILVKNWYTLPFETCLMLLLYQSKLKQIEAKRSKSKLKQIEANNTYIASSCCAFSTIENAWGSDFSDTIAATHLK
jgi:hypothetical protein